MSNSIAFVGSIENFKSSFDGDFVKDFPSQPADYWEVVLVDANLFPEDELQIRLDQWTQSKPALEILILQSAGYKNTNPASDGIVLESSAKKKTEPVSRSFRNVDASNTSGLVNEILVAQEKSRWKKQQFDLRGMLDERLKELTSLEQVLIHKIEKKTKIAQETRAKLYWASSRQELLKKCLLSLQESETVEEMESHLLSILATSFELAWVKILSSPEDQRFLKQVEKKVKSTQLRMPLYNENNEIGSLIAVKVGKMHFSKEQIDFFKQLSEATAMAIGRKKNLERTLGLQQEWDTTFNAIQDPLLLIHENYDIIQMNRSEKLEGRKKCYEYLFSRNTPCLQCSRGKKFVLEDNEKAFEVLSQSFFLEDLQRDVYVNTYLDISDKNRIQKKLIESAKIAELGLVGSSIAHEINNPLGGLLSYIQLIKMDLSPDDEKYVDIVEMEKATQRCITIVKKLLEFSQKDHH